MANDATRIRPFSAGVRQQPGGAVIDLHGEMDSFAEAGLAVAFAEASAGQPERIALNFSDVDYINSTGIALIVGVLARARQASIPLSAYGLSEHYREIFEITRLSDFMTISDNERGALAQAP